MPSDEVSIGEDALWRDFSGEGQHDSAGGSLEGSLSDVFSGLTDGGFDIDEVAGLAKKFFLDFIYV
jgi:hypothetical protein